MRFLGIDIGSSSVKLSVLDGETGRGLASIQYPEAELEILSPQTGWAEQHPDTWWECIQEGCKQLFKQEGVDPHTIEAIGIAYQMHGLVLVDDQGQVLRPAIIWCDSRAVAQGEEALKALGNDYCFEHLLNSPGNFTASKLRWVQENEPEIFQKIHKIMLPGDYIAMKLSGEFTTTASGLSEGTLWDYKVPGVANKLLEYWGISTELIPDLVPSLGEQVSVSHSAAQVLGLKAGVKVCYRAGDQPNNAFSLNVLEPGEVAATAGTSGVIYGVTDKPLADIKSRVNTFLHVTNTPAHPRNGVLVCVNGAGRAYSWLRHLLETSGHKVDYELLNELAKKVPVGSEDLVFHPFGNGAERIFQNRILSGQLLNIDFNRHTLNHIVRASQEGIVFALNMGFDVLKSLGGDCAAVKVAYGNMFSSEVFGTLFANTTQTAVELFDTDGAEGAARGAALGFSYYSAASEAFAGLCCTGVIEPSVELQAQYQDTYQQWLETLPDL